MKTAILLTIPIVLILCGQVLAELPSGWYEGDIGEIDVPGSTLYDTDTQTWTVTGGSRGKP